MLYRWLLILKSVPAAQIYLASLQGLQATFPRRGTGARGRGTWWCRCHCRIGIRILYKYDAGISRLQCSYSRIPFFLFGNGNLRLQFDLPILYAPAGQYIVPWKTARLECTTRWLYRYFTYRFHWRFLVKSERQVDRGSGNEVFRLVGLNWLIRCGAMDWIHYYLSIYPTRMGIHGIRKGCGAVQSSLVDRVGAWTCLDPDSDSDSIANST